MSIDLLEVSKSYGTEPAVRSLSLSVQAGRLFAFLGPNGAGKTTTIKLICGLLRPDSGSVRVCGLDIRTHPREARTQLAYVPDMPFVYEKLTGRELCEFIARVYRMNEAAARNRMLDLATRFGMLDRLDNLTESYSHGMKQKIALIAALLHEPRVLVVDEPMVGLDPASTRKVKDFFVELTRAGVTVFMSTHTLELAESIADQVGIIHRGQLVAMGSVDEILADRTKRRLEDVFLQLTEEQREQADTAQTPRADA